MCVDVTQENVGLVVVVSLLVVVSVVIAAVLNVMWESMQDVPGKGCEANLNDVQISVHQID